MKKLFKKLKPHWDIWWAAQKFSIKIVRREDAFGKTYRYTYYKYGHKAMLDEYLNEDTWNVNEEKWQAKLKKYEK